MNSTNLINPTVNYNTMVNDSLTGRQYTGFPLNSTLVSSYTADTIRSIINQAASGQAYNTPVWIRVARIGIQVSAKDPQIARTRKPVFIPLNLIHDIFMQPTINNVICIVYDEIQSNMKGVLLYVVNPSDAILIREDFRQVKQGLPVLSANQSTFNVLNENRFVQTRQNSPQRIVYLSEGIPPTNPMRYTPSKSSQHSSREDRPRRRKSPKKNRYGRSPGRPATDEEQKQTTKIRSRSLDKSSKTEDLEKEQNLLQQQMVVWQPQTQQQQQQMPLIPMGIYNRYVPKTIPLPSGETLKTTLPTDSSNTIGFAFIEPMVPERTQEPVKIPIKKIENNNNTNTNIPKPQLSTKNNDDEDETKIYLKLLIEEMQSLKAEMHRLRQMSGTTARGRSDSIQIDLRQLRTEIDTIRSRIAMTPKIFENN